MAKLKEIEAKISVTMTKHKMSATQISERINWFGTRQIIVTTRFFFSRTWFLKMSSNVQLLGHEADC